MADDAEFQFVAASVRRAVRLQREYVDRFLEGATDGFQAIGTQFRTVCDQIDESIDRNVHEYSESTDAVHRELLLTNSRELLGHAKNLQRLRLWLDAAGTPPIDLGSYYFLSSLAKRLVRNDTQLTVVAAHDTSYATIVNPFHPGGAGTPPRDIVLVATIPHRETRSGLLHPLLVHEIGHGAAQVHKLADTAASEMAPLVDSILDDAAERAAGLGKNEADERAILSTRLPAWIEEIYCDAIGTACLGATYLFSFVAEVLPNDIDRAGPEHPPTRQRVRLILEHLDRLGWTPRLRSEVPALFEYLHGLASQGLSLDNPGDEGLRQSIDLLGSKIQDHVDAHVGDNAATPDSSALDTVAALITEGVPPAQNDDKTAINCPMIIAGCWLAALKSGGGTVEALADAVDSPELEKLLPYALELSALVDNWQAA